MKKNNFKPVSLITVFCIVMAYFALMSPTTAYFYQSNNKLMSFDFALLETQQTISDKAVDMNFKDATKFEDFSEYLFDDVAFVQTVNLNNTGDIPAKIYVDVPLQNLSRTNGLRYIILFGEISSSGETSSQSEVSTTEAQPQTTTTTKSSGLSKGPLKAEIESALNDFDSSFVSGISQSSADTVLNNFNKQYMLYNKTPVLQPGDSIEIRVVFWVEYDNFTNALKLYGDFYNVEYKARVIVYAAQDSTSAVPTTSAY